MGKVTLLLKTMPSHGMQVPKVSYKALQDLSLVHAPNSFHISPWLTVYNSVKTQPVTVHHPHTHVSLLAFAQVTPLPAAFTISLIPSLLAWLTLTASLRLNSGKLFLNLSLLYLILG